MNEREIKSYLEKNNQEFIKRYILKCISHKYNDCQVQYLGSEIRTGIGLHRADMVYIIKTLDPIVVVVELKTEASSDSIIQVQNYIKEFKKTKILEKTQDMYLPTSYRYVGIVVGKWLRPIVKRLIESDFSYQLSYVEFRNNQYKCIDEDTVYYYTDEKYWLECGVF